MLTTHRSSGGLSPLGCSSSPDQHLRPCPLAPVRQMALCDPVMPAAVRQGLSNTQGSGGLPRRVAISRCPPITCLLHGPHRKMLCLSKAYLFVQWWAAVVQSAERVGTRRLCADGRGGPVDTRRTAVAPALTSHQEEQGVAIFPQALRGL